MSVIKIGDVKHGVWFQFFPILPNSTIARIAQTKKYIKLRWHVIIELDEHYNWAKHQMNYISTWTAVRCEYMETWKRLHLAKLSRNYCNWHFPKFRSDNNARFPRKQMKRWIAFVHRSAASYTLFIRNYNIALYCSHTYTHIFFFFSNLLSIAVLGSVAS